MTKHTQNNNDISKILITGGTGLVGRYLSKLLTNAGYDVSHLSRRVPQKNTTFYKTYTWDGTKMGVVEALKQTDAVIHLAGENVSTKKWTKKQKQLIYDSRVQTH